MNILIRRTILVLALIWSAAQAQDYQFSQFYANQVLLNPAFTGAAEGPRLALNMRSQWSSIPGAYKTFAASFDMPVMFGPTRHGLGLTVVNDQAGAGILNKTEFLVNYAYRFLIDNNSAIRLGLAGGFRNTSIDFMKLRFPDETPPNYPSPPNTISADKLGLSSQNPSRFDPEVTFGALYYTKRVWAGFTAKHIVGTQEAFILKSSPPASAALPIYASLYAGVQIPLDANKEGRIAVSPAIMYRHQEPFNQLDLGAYLTLDPIVLGMWYRMNDAVIGLIGIRRGMFSFGYSYDYTVSSLSNSVSGGSHEISLIVEFERLANKKRPKTNMSCPTF